MAKYKDSLSVFKHFLILLIILGFLYLIAISLIDLKTTPIMVEFMVNYADQKRQFAAPPSWVVDSISVGDEERGDKSKLLSKIIDIKSVEDGPNRVYWIKVEIQANISERSGKIRFKNQPVEIGSTINVVPNAHNLEGVVVGISGRSTSQFKRVNLEGVVYGRRLEIAQAVKVGDQNDSAMITEVYYSPSVNQNPQFPKDKLYDIHLKINLETLVRKDIMYYAFFQPLKVGNRLWIPLPNYNLYDLVVTKILGQQ